MEKFSYTKALREVGISYLGKFNQSAKMVLSGKAGMITYCLYLAPWNMSGYQVCPAGHNCHKSCLNGSGRNIGDTIHGEFKTSNINISRIKKTRLFYENRDLFMRIMIHEIIRAKMYAERNNFEFSVRINGTSDLSPVLFIDPVTGLNLLELFPDVQFYDYTKVYRRYQLLDIYDNYDLTFSYDGYNEADCIKVLKNAGKVAVVFYGEMPKYFWGYPVIDGNKDDIRFKNKGYCIIGLHYHRTANDYATGRYVAPNDPFIVKQDNPGCRYHD